MSDYLSALANGRAGEAHSLAEASPELTSAESQIFKDAKHISDVHVDAFIETDDGADNPYGIVPVSFKVGSKTFHDTIGVARHADKEWHIQQVAIPSDVLDDRKVWTRDGGKTADDHLESVSISLPNQSDVTTTVSINGHKVSSETESSLTLPPATYTIDKATASGTSQYFDYTTGKNSDRAADLGPGKTLQIGDATAIINDAGKKRIEDTLASLFDAKWESVQDFGMHGTHTDDANSPFALHNSFTDDAFTAENTNYESGGLKVDVTDGDGQKQSVTHEDDDDLGTYDILGVAFYPGSTDWGGNGNAGPLDRPVEASGASGSRPVVTIRDDGTFATTTPASMKVETTVTSVGGPYRSDVFANGMTTWNGHIALNWSPAGKLTADGKVKIRAAE